MAFILVSDADRFFSNFLFDHKDEPFDNYEILVISKDIIADQKIVTEDGTSSYQSRYENIDFDLTLVPTPKVFEFYHGSTPSSYVESYQDQLMLENRLTSLCCIVDLVVNDNRNVVMLCSKAEYRMEYLHILLDFLSEQFKIKGYDIDAYLEKEDITQIGDVEEIRKMLLFHMTNLELIDTDTGLVMNSLMSDMVEKYKEVLMNKDKEELFRIAVNKGAYVNKRRPKEEIVDHILKKMLNK